MLQNKPKITVSFISLGCPKNLVDTENFMTCLTPDCFEFVSPTQPADVCIINTCCFIHDAKKESIDTILEIAAKKKAGLFKKIVVTGCLTERYRDELPDLLPEVDSFVGISEQAGMAKIIKEILDSDLKTSKNGPDARPSASTQPERTRKYVRIAGLRTTQQMGSFWRFSRYIKISEGCSHQCSFCIIPKVRGPLVSQTPDDIVTEIKSTLKNGVKEFNLIAQDLNEYGRDLHPRGSLTRLLDTMDKVDGEFWLRLLYMYPLQFPDKLIKLIAQSKHILKYVDIPLQHISDHMLRLMNRGSSSKYIYRLIEKLKTEIPDIVIRTTFLVGHPGETQKDFEQLMRFVKDIEFDRVGVFTYSHEENTPASSMKDPVLEKTAQARKDALLKLQQKISLKKNRQWIGKTVRTLIEGPSKESDLLWQGRFYGQAPDIDGVILINKGSAPIGSFADVKITDAFEYDLLGEMINNTEVKDFSCARTLVSS